MADDTTPADSSGQARVSRAELEAENAQLRADNAALRARVVELNGQVVSDKRSLKLSTPHRFTHDGHDYEVVFQISSLLSGLFEVFLYRNGKLLDSDQGRHQSIPVNHETGQVDWRRYGLQIFLWTMAGGVVGGIFGFLVASLTKGAGA